MHSVHLQVARIGRLIGSVLLAITLEHRLNFGRQIQAERGFDQSMQKNYGHRTRLSLGSHARRGFFFAQHTSKHKHRSVETPGSTPESFARFRELASFVDRTRYRGGKRHPSVCDLGGEFARLGRESRNMQRNPIGNIDKTLGIQKTDLAARAVTLPFDHVAGQQLANDTDILTHLCKPHRPSPIVLRAVKPAVPTENSEGYENS